MCIEGPIAVTSNSEWFPKGKLRMGSIALPLAIPPKRVERSLSDKDRYPKGEYRRDEWRSHRACLSPTQDIVFVSLGRH